MGGGRNDDRESEINKFDMSVGIDENIFQLDISVDDSFLMEILNSFNKLFEDYFGLKLINSPILFLLEVSIQRKARSVFQN